MLWSLHFLFRWFFAGRWIAALIFTSLTIYFPIFCCWVHIALPCHIISIFFGASWRSLSVVTDYWSGSRLWCWCRSSWNSLLLSNKLSFRSWRLFLWRFLLWWLFSRRLSSSLTSTGLSISFDILGSWIKITLSSHVVCNLLSTSLIFRFIYVWGWGWMRGNGSWRLLFYLCLESVSDGCHCGQLFLAFYPYWVYWLSSRTSWLPLNFPLSFRYFRRRRWLNSSLRSVLRNRFLFSWRFFSSGRVPTWTFTYLTINFHIFGCWVHVTLGCHIHGVSLWTPSALIWSYILSGLSSRSRWRRYWSLLFLWLRLLTSCLRSDIGSNLRFFFNFWLRNGSWLWCRSFLLCLIFRRRRFFVLLTLGSTSLHISGRGIQISFSSHLVRGIFWIPWWFTLQRSSWRLLLILHSICVNPNIIIWLVVCFPNWLSSISWARLNYLFLRLLLPFFFSIPWSLIVKNRSDTLCRAINSLNVVFSWSYRFFRSEVLLPILIDTLIHRFSWKSSSFLLFGLFAVNRRNIVEPFQKFSGRV